MIRSPRERIGAKLELYHLVRSPFAAFDVEGRSGAVLRFEDVKVGSAMSEGPRDP